MIFVLPCLFRTSLLFILVRQVNEVIADLPVQWVVQSLVLTSSRLQHHHSADCFLVTAMSRPHRRASVIFASFLVLCVSFDALGGGGRRIDLSLAGARGLQVFNIASFFTSSVHFSDFLCAFFSLCCGLPVWDSLFEVFRLRRSLHAFRILQRFVLANASNSELISFK